jgi:outer membrane protein assembly factor BamD
LVRPIRSVALFVLGACLLVGCGAGVLPSVHSESERLEIARRLAAEGECGNAIELLKTYIANNSGSAQIDEAIYLLGSCYLSTKEWASAALEFERLLRDYPESDSSAAASFRLGEARFGQARPPDFDQDFTEKALQQWESYLRDHPGHWLNTAAEQQIQAARKRLATKLVNTGKLYLKLKLSEPARAYFTKVAEDYSETDLIGEAWVGLALADAMEEKRPEAIERLKQVESRFAGQPIAHRAARERVRLEH